MRYLKSHIVIVIIFFVVISSFLNSKQVIAQIYDRDQINYVIKQLKAKKLLDKLVDSTQAEADYKKSATRADVLIASYLVIDHLGENTSFAELNQKLILLQNSITNLEKRSGGARYPTEELLVQKVVAQVEADLASKQASVPEKKQPSDKIQISDKMNKELDELRDNIETIKKSLKSAPSQRIDKLEQKVNHNSIIASVAVVLSLVITLFAAR